MSRCLVYHMTQGCFVELPSSATQNLRSGNTWVKYNSGTPRNVVIYTTSRTRRCLPVLWHVQAAKSCRSQLEALKHPTMLASECFPYTCACARSLLLVASRCAGAGSVQMRRPIRFQSLFITQPLRNPNHGSSDFSRKLLLD